MINTKMLIELVGYLGSLLVVASMLMTSVRKLRIVNTIGSTIFTIYALIIHSYPTAFMNLCLILINLYQLRKLGQNRGEYQLIREDATSGVMSKILENNAADILNYFPNSGSDAVSLSGESYLVTYGTIPAGILLGKRSDDDTYDIIIDYALPAYRDCSVGAFLYEHLKDDGIKRLRYKGGSKKHEEYVLKMGFERTDEGFVKEL